MIFLRIQNSNFYFKQVLTANNMLPIKLLHKPIDIEHRLSNGIAYTFTFVLYNLF